MPLGLQGPVVVDKDYYDAFKIFFLFPHMTLDQSMWCGTFLNQNAFRILLKAVCRRDRLICGGSFNLYGSEGPAFDATHGAFDAVEVWSSTGSGKKRIFGEDMGDHTAVILDGEGNRVSMSVASTCYSADASSATTVPVVPVSSPTVENLENAFNLAPLPAPQSTDAGYIDDATEVLFNENDNGIAELDVH